MSPAVGTDVLIVTGARMGSSGTILSYIMHRAVNRNSISVKLDGFGGTSGPAIEIKLELVEQYFGKTLYLSRTPVYGWGHQGGR